MLPKIRDWFTNFWTRLPGQGAPTDPDAELQRTADRHLLLLDAKRGRLRAYVAGELARAEAGEDTALPAAPQGRFRRGK